MSTGRSQARDSAKTFAVLALGLGAGVAAGDSFAQASRCRTSDCFNDGDVRMHEVINDGTIVIYVGRQRCPFLVKVNELYCNLTFLPEVEFIKTRGRTQEVGVNRVCTHDTGLALNTFGFSARDAGPGSTSPTDPFSGADFSCRVMEMRPLTDDELVEIYVQEGIIPPPPPMGPGTISRSEQQQDETTTGSEDEAGGETDNSSPADE